MIVIPIRARSTAWKNTVAFGPPVVSFAAEAWREYVPIRMADMICIQEHLPSGAAAVLINQTHTNRDLILLITAAEMRWLDAIDGNRKIGEIVERSSSASSKPAQLQPARTFFEQLWRYDQVGFDASACTAAKPG
jgi:hypothetical protein